MNEEMPLQQFRTAPYPCSYLVDEVASSQVIYPPDQIQPSDYSHLIQTGFRRSGNMIYRPQCISCQRCVSLRIPVATFQPSRSQRRCEKNHRHLNVELQRPHFNREHYALYALYQNQRHALDVQGQPEDTASPEVYTDFLVNSPVNTLLATFYAPAQSQADTAEPENLLMASVIDVIADGLSAVYTFYNPSETSGLGTYNILWQIELARKLSLPYVYLGYWVNGCDKMSYKTRFNPHEILQNDQWVVANLPS